MDPFNNDNNSNNNPNPAPQPAPQPTSSNQPFFGFGTSTTGPDAAAGMTGAITSDPAANSSAEPAPSVPNPNNVLSPTGFTDAEQQRLLAEQQAQQAAAQQAATAKKFKQPEDPQKTIKKFMILSIVLGVAAIIFLFLGIWGLIDAASTRSKLSDAQEVNNTYAEIINSVEEQTGTTISTVDDLPVYSPAEDYIYINGWNIKLKIPDTLTSVSYILNQNADYRPSICFNAVKSGVQYFPAFADINQNPGGMGCLRRVAKTDGESDADGNSFGQKVFTNEDYNYFYKEPSKTFSGTDAEKGLEATAVQLIKNMITDNISAYK